MTIVRDHMSEHEQAEAVPLLTEKARVTDVSALDEDRSDAVRRAVASLLERHGEDHLVDEDDPPTVDWEGVESLVNREGGPPGERLDTLRQRYRRAYPSLLSVTFEAEEEEIDFVPGQYVTVEFHETPRPYSIASSPERDRIRLCIRRVPGGHLTPDLFEHLDPGDEFTVRGPNGEFVLEPPSARDMAFLATGTGVAPLKSMLDYTFEQGRDVYEGRARDVWLFLGTSWRDDLAFHDHFRDLAAAHDNFHYVPTLSRERFLSEWDGETAYVQRTLLKYVADGVDGGVSGDRREYLDAPPATDVEARIDPSDLEVYACGVNAMVETLVETVRELGVPRDLIQGEGYG